MGWAAPTAVARAPGGAGSELVTDAPDSRAYADVLQPILAGG